MAKTMKAAASTDVFEEGPYGAAHITEKASKDIKVISSLPVDVFIVTPTTKGSYPVLLFCHGWKMTNEWYSNIFDLIASHGYIVVAPQFYGLLWDISITDEIGKAKGVTEWLSTGLLSALRKNGYDNIYPDVENNLAVWGHSRGGKVAFALALGYPCDKVNQNKRSTVQEKFKAVIGVDPVGGVSPLIRPKPNVLKYIPRCFDMSIPVAVVGTGYGNQWKCLIPPSAANGVNHSEFFNESKPPVCYFLAKEFGHFDMMDDNVVLLDLLRSFFAMSGKSCSRGLMRKAVGGIVVAFLRAYLGGMEEDLDAIVEDPSIAPIVLEPVLHVKE